MKIVTLGDAKVIVHNAGSFHNYFAWPTVTRFRMGKLRWFVPAIGWGIFAPLARP